MNLKKENQSRELQTLAIKKKSLGIYKIVKTYQRMAFQFYIKINSLNNNKKNLTQVKPGFKTQLHPNKK